MPITDTIVIGAGQAGLAVSRCLTDRGVDHVVLERGRIAERWRSERWDSLRLLTPNWMSRLPGWAYTGADPDGYMTAAEVADYLQGYADASAAPVREDSAVVDLAGIDDGFEVVTTSGTWRAGNVVIATGWCDQPAVPAMARPPRPRHRPGHAGGLSPPGLAAGRRCAGRRRLGHRRAARRRARPRRP